MSQSWDQLVDDLKHAQAIHEKSHAELGSMIALRCVVAYLSRERVPIKLLGPLRSLAADIADRAQRASGLVEKSQLEALNQARAAATVHVLKESKHSASYPEAARAVATAIGGVFSAQELLEFRKNIGKRRARQDAIDAYDQHKKLLSAEPLPSRAAVALAVIRDVIVPAKKG